MKSFASLSFEFRFVFGLTAALGLSVGCSSSTSYPKDAAAGHDGATSETGADGSATDTATDLATDMAVSTDGADADGSVLTTAEARGLYLTGVLGCVNCHSPKLTTGAVDPANLFAGVDCTADSSGNCLSTPNLTPDTTGIKNDTDQQIIDAFRTGRVPQAAAGADGGSADAGVDGGADAAGSDGGVGPEYLFANMPYYQFANLTDTDAQAIVAYLRSATPVAHMPKANAGTFTQRPTAPQWTPADPSKLPPPGTGAPADAVNGEYFATLLCATCHTVNTTATDGGAVAPLHIDETKGFQGGKNSSITVDGGAMTFQSANLTPDMSGIKEWTVADLVKAIQTDKDRDGKTLCSPMRANAVITTADATAIADYLLSVPPVVNTINACMARM